MHKRIKPDTIESLKTSKGRIINKVKLHEKIAAMQEAGEDVGDLAGMDGIEGSIEIKPDDTFPLHMWSYVEPCKGTTCPIAKQCEYKKKGKCEIQRQFINSVAAPMVELVQRTGDPFIAQWVGFHLMPLYRQLVKFYIRELSLDDVLVTSKKGDIMVHPIYKAINETGSKIIELWNKTKLLEIAEAAGYLKASLMPPGEFKKTGTVRGKWQYGSGSHGEMTGYYETMAKPVSAEKKVDK